MFGAEGVRDNWIWLLYHHEDAGVQHQHLSPNSSLRICGLRSFITV